MPWEEAVPTRCVISGTATQTISPSVHRASCSPAGDGGWGTTMAVGNNGDCSQPHHAVGGGSPGGGGRWHQQRAPNQWQVWGARKEVPTGVAKGWCRGMLGVARPVVLLSLLLQGTSPVLLRWCLWGARGKGGRGGVTRAALTADVGTCRHPLQMCMEEVWRFL